MAFGGLSLGSFGFKPPEILINKKKKATVPDPDPISKPTVVVPDPDPIPIPEGTGGFEPLPPILDPNAPGAITGGETEGYKARPPQAHSGTGIGGGGRGKFSIKKQPLKQRTFRI